MERIGEIIEASTTRFMAGTYRLHEAPPFGALVQAQTRIEGLSIYGLVYDICTGSKEPGGRAVVRGRTYSGRTLYDNQIYDEHPDLSEVLQTEFSAITVGFAKHETMYQYLPPQPPTVHYSVYMCSVDELVRFSESSDFFRGVLFSTQIPGDELLAATVRAIAQARNDSRAYLVRAGREIACLLKDDYDRLTALLRRIKPVLH
jgi:hypothetical protein